MKNLFQNANFWAALVAIVTTVLVSLNVQQGSITQITTIIAAAGAFVAFVLSNSAIQIALIKKDTAQLKKETAELVKKK
jgi:hypothetical protein